MITQQRLKELLSYSPESGLFTWMVNRGTRGKAGAIAGCKCRRSCSVLITIDNKPYGANRLAFLYMTGKIPGNVYNLNDDFGDNRWCNLSEGKSERRHRNRRRNSNNTSGVTGVGWYKEKSKWQAYIRFKYLFYRLGLFDDKFDAICARKSAEVRMGFHENHGV